MDSTPHSPPADAVAHVALDIRLSTAGQYDDRVRAALAVLAEMDDADRVYITMYDGDGTFRNSHEWLRETTPSHRDFVVNLAVADFPWSIGLAERNEILNVGSLAEIPEEGSTERLSFGLFDVKAIMQVPIFVCGRLRGVIGSNKVRAARASDTATLRAALTIAAAMAEALERQDQERRMIAAIETAERALREKEALLERLGHDLRTPLNAILGFTELLRLDGMSSVARSAAVNHITDAGRTLLQLLDELIVEREPDPATRLGGIPLRRVVERARDHRHPGDASRRVHLSLLPGLAGVHVLADESALATVLGTLIAAAGSSGEHVTNVDVDARTEGSECVVTVQDRTASVISGVDEGSVRSTLEAGWVPAPVVPMDISDPFSAPVLLGDAGTGRRPQRSARIMEQRKLELALARSRSIAARMRGAITLGHCPGGGVVAELRLPLAGR